MDMHTGSSHLVHCCIAEWDAGPCGSVAYRGFKPTARAKSGFKKSMVTQSDKTTPPVSTPFAFQSHLHGCHANDASMKQVWDHAALMAEYLRKSSRRSCRLRDECTDLDAYDERAVRRGFASAAPSPRCYGCVFSIAASSEVGCDVHHALRSM